MLPGLKVKIGADTSELESKLSSTQRSLLRFAKVAAAAAAVAAAATAALTARAMQTIDAQAKLGRTLGTTTKSMQVLARAGELAGVEMAGIAQATKDLTRRLSQAAATGAGPASDTLKKLGLSVSDLMAMPLDQRVMAINSAIDEFIPAAQRAAVAGMLFGEEGSLAIRRIDTATIRQATQDIEDFGVGVSDIDAAAIETANDAISRLALVWQGFSNRMAVAVAPILTRVADAIAAMTKVTGPLYNLFSAFADRLPAYTAVLTAFGAAMAAKVAVGLVAARIAAVGFSGALTLMRGALIRTGIGALVVLMGEAAYWLSEGIKKVGGFGNAMTLLGDVWSGVWSGILRATEALPLGLEATWNNIKSGFYSMVMSIQDVWAGLLAGMVDGLRGTLLENTGAFTSLDTAATNAATAVYETQLKINKLQGQADAAGKAAGTALTEGFNQATEAAGKLMAVVNGDTPSEGPNVTPGATLGGDGAPGTPETPPGFGSGAGGALDKIKSDLQALQDGFKSAEQIMLDNYAKQQKILEDALRNKLVTMQQYNALMQKVEQTHQFNMTKSANQGVSDTLNALGQLFQGSKKIGAAVAVANSWMAFTEVLKDPSFVGRPWARFAAAASALASGLNAVRNIKSASPGGAGGVASPAAAAQAAPAPLEVRMSGLNASSLFTGAQVGALLDRLSDEAGDRGLRLLVAQ